MTRTDLIDLLITRLKESEKNGTGSVTVTDREAAEIAHLLMRQMEDSGSEDKNDERVLFYCARCGKSFREVPREDEETLRKYHYHRWFANCPWCREEVLQTDRYWR